MQRDSWEGGERTAASCPCSPRSEPRAAQSTGLLASTLQVTRKTGHPTTLSGWHCTPQGLTDQSAGTEFFVPIGGEEGVDQHSGSSPDPSLQGARERER